MWQPGMSMIDVEREVIAKALKFYQGNKTQTANSLGIAIRTLDSKIEKYGLLKKKEEPEKPRRMVLDKKMEEIEADQNPKGKKGGGKMFEKLIGRSEGQASA